MLRFLNQCSQGRGAWLLMAFTALALELTALWFQHVMLLKPCVLCIYERCALFGVLGAALIGAIAPKTPLRYVAMVIWLYSAFRGVQLTYEHTMLQLYPSPFATCDFMRSEEHTSELQVTGYDLVCRLLLEKKKI